VLYFDVVLVMNKERTERIVSSWKKGGGGEVNEEKAGEEDTKNIS
jgi:hypothetical protein